MRHLASLDLSYNRLVAAGTLLLASSFSSWPYLEALYLSHNFIANTAVPLVKALEAHQNRLKVLDFGHNYIGHEGVPTSKPHPNPDPKLNLNPDTNPNNKPYVEGLMAIFKFIGPSLQDLSLAGNEFPSSEECDELGANGKCFREYYTILSMHLKEIRTLTFILNPNQMPNLFGDPN